MQETYSTCTVKKENIYYTDTAKLLLQWCHIYNLHILMDIMEEMSGLNLHLHLITEDNSK